MSTRMSALLQTDEALLRSNVQLYNYRMDWLHGDTVHARSVVAKASQASEAEMAAIYEQYDNHPLQLTLDDAQAFEAMKQQALDHLRQCPGKPFYDVLHIVTQFEETLL